MMHAIMQVLGDLGGGWPARLLTSLDKQSRCATFTLRVSRPLIEQEVVGRRGWVTKEEMVDLIAISQSCPGVFAINLSTFIGYRLRKTRGALCTSIGTAMPSFLCILLIAMFFHQFGDNPVVAAIFRGIRPAVVALIAVPTFDLARSAKVGWANCWIPIAGALAIWALGVSPILIIILAGLGGYIYGKYIKPTE